MKKFIALAAILVLATSCLGFGGGFGFPNTIDRITPGTTINQTCEQDYYPGTTIIQSVNIGGTTVVDTSVVRVVRPTPDTSSSSRVIVIIP